VTGGAALAHHHLEILNHSFNDSRAPHPKKLVTEDTVDAHIYRIQERKAKMNAAILENGKDRESSASSKGDDAVERPKKQADGKKELSHILQTAISNFERRNKGNG